MPTPLQMTYGGLFVGVLANQLGLPIPAVILMMAAGALSRHGQMDASIAVLVSILGCLAGDAIWFCIGRRWGANVIRLLCRFTPDPRGCSKKARQQFQRHGVPILCVAKFLPGADALMPPLAGAEGVSLTSFLALDAVGSLLWAAAYLSVGYLFANQLDVAVRGVQQFGAVLGIGIGLPLILYAAWRGLLLVRMIRQLRLRRISPPMLARKLKSGRKLAVLDLLNFEDADESESPEAIPGSFSIDPAVLRKSPQIAVPHDLSIVLYSSSGSDTVSARAALGLQRIGIQKVWVLEGGLRAWREHGFPVSQSLELPEAMAERYGIKLPQM